jgi:RNA polymerase sigma-70 factor (ECF subfamily)
MERRLVERAMHGDEAAFDDLVGRVGNHLHSVARRILRDPYLAEDATQRALLDTWQNLPRLRDPDRFEAWTYRLLVNASSAEARREPEPRSPDARERQPSVVPRDHRPALLRRAWHLPARQHRHLARHRDLRCARELVV